MTIHYCFRKRKESYVKRFILLIFCASTLFAKAPPIVFIHLGRNMPSHYFHAIKQARTFNPNSDIYLLLQTATIKALKRCAHLDDVHVVNVDKLPKTASHQKFSGKAVMENRFWRYALERFFYLDAFLRETRLTDVFHLEGDNMIYANLEKRLPAFHTLYSDIGVPYREEKMCIAGIVYIRHPKAIEAFTEFVAERFLPKSDDMQLMASFAKATGLVQPLPVLPTEFIEEEGFRKADVPALYTYGEEEFGAFFDAVAMGQLLDGLSPQHEAKGKPYANAHVPFDPLKWKVVFRGDDKGKRVPFMVWKDKSYRLISLHIHSKNLWKFRS